MKRIDQKMRFILVHYTNKGYRMGISGLGILGTLLVLVSIFLVALIPFYIVYIIVKKAVKSGIEESLNKHKDA